MKKLSLADKMAKKSFESDQFQKSWAVHMQAFGPILEPAFRDDYQAKVHLCAALNHISSRNLSQGLDKLKTVQKFCVSNEDKAAFLFFMGVFSEMAGNTEQMLAFYTYANEYNHRFYLPYIKVGKFYLDGCMYDRAEENYRAAIGCFTATGPDHREKMILGSAYANLATCLTMMHRYEEAEAALATSRSICPEGPGRSAAEAVLFAIREDRGQAEEALAVLKRHAPGAYEGLRESVEKILAHTDPKFFPAAVDEAKITAFWAWFESYEATLKQKLDRQDYEAALSPVGDRLLAAFPFLEEVPNITLGQNEQGYVLQLSDLYAVAVTDAYEKLLLQMPEELKARWQFAVVH